MLRRPQGFTLMELLVVLTTIGFLAQGFYLWQRGMVEDQIVQRTVAGFALVDEAAYAFRVDSGAPPAWPGSMAVLTPYLGAGSPANGVGTGYTLTANPSSLRIATTMLDAGQARAVARAFPANATFDPVTFVVALEIPIPGHETSHNALLPRDGSRAMVGDLDFGAFSAINVDRVEATGTVQGSLGILTDDVTAGGSCNTEEIGTTSTGELLSCVSGTWEQSGCALHSMTAARSGINHVVAVRDTCGNVVQATLNGSNA